MTRRAIIFTLSITAVDARNAADNSRDFISSAMSALIAAGRAANGAGRCSQGGGHDRHRK
jgi:hypothetical protein